MQTPEEFARHLLRGLTCSADQRFYDDAAKDIAAALDGLPREVIERELRIADEQGDDPTNRVPQIIAALRKEILDHG